MKKPLEVQPPETNREETGPLSSSPDPSHTHRAV